MRPVRGTGRIGRTEASRKFDEPALTAAVVAAVRYTYTDYNELLVKGVDRAFALQQVADRVNSRFRRA